MADDLLPGFLTWRNSGVPIKRRMEQDIHIWDIELTDEEMAKVAAKDLGRSEIVDHEDPVFVKMLCDMDIHE